MLYYISFIDVGFMALVEGQVISAMISYYPFRIRIESLEERGDGNVVFCWLNIMLTNRNR